MIPFEILGCDMSNLGVCGLGFFCLSIWFAVLQQAYGLRPISESARSWGDEVCVDLMIVLIWFPGFVSAATSLISFLFNVFVDLITLSRQRERELLLQY